jgi:hypothetical protein
MQGQNIQSKIQGEMVEGAKHLVIDFSAYRQILPIVLPPRPTSTRNIGYGGYNSVGLYMHWGLNRLYV